MRYIWDMKELYYDSFNIIEKIGYKIFYRYLKKWDISSSSNIDGIVANSEFVKNRIKVFWNKSSTIINPTINFKWVFRC